MCTASGLVIMDLIRFVQLQSFLFCVFFACIKTKVNYLCEVPMQQESTICVTRICKTCTEIPGHVCMDLSSMC